jgi:hypothetical protein
MRRTCTGHEAESMMLLNLCADALIAPSPEGFTLISIRPERLPDDAIQISVRKQAASQSVNRQATDGERITATEFESAGNQPKSHWKAGDYPPRL